MAHVLQKTVHPAILRTNLSIKQGGEESKEVKMKKGREKLRRENFEIYGKEVQQ